MNSLKAKNIQTRDLITEYKIKYVLKVFESKFYEFGEKKPSFGFESSELVS